MSGLTPARGFAKDAKMSIEQFIDNEVKSNDVVLFMKGTPQFPQCGFSGQVVQILDHVGVGYKGLNVLESAELRNGIKTYSNWPTIPQLYVKGEFVGGCDIIREMFQAGELQQLLADKGVTVSAAASVPEPETFTLFAIGLLGLGLARGKKIHACDDVRPNEGHDRITLTRCQPVRWSHTYRPRTHSATRTQPARTLLPLQTTKPASPFDFRTTANLEQ